MSSHYFCTKNAVLHYLKIGTGDRIMICFHGFGQEASVFSSLASTLTKNYTLYAFDLFYHGNSKWNNCEKAILPTELSQIFEEWIEEQQLEKLSLCGYSLGGKIVLSLLEHLSTPIEKVLLIAPDGIDTNFWYDLATYPYWARRLFKYTVNKPEIFFRIANGLGKIKIIDRGVIKFAKYQMNTRKKREKVYCSWLSYRKIKADIARVSKKININEVKLTIYLGAFDRIITDKRVRPLTNRVTFYEKFILDKGHNTLIKDVSEVIDESF